ncbi:hypothetical protein HDV00_011662 [Rhizophlyctis rosea]|nr:hypothetical protein HDV00_011662 [Rhizophlyctis rosea]
MKSSVPVALNNETGAGGWTVGTLPRPVRTDDTGTLTRPAGGSFTVASLPRGFVMGTGVDKKGNDGRVEMSANRVADGAPARAAKAAPVRDSDIPLALLQLPYKGPRPLTNPLRIAPPPRTSSIGCTDALKYRRPSEPQLPSQTSTPQYSESALRRDSEPVVALKKAETENPLPTPPASEESDNDGSESESEDEATPLATVQTNHFNSLPRPGRGRRPTRGREAASKQPAASSSSLPRRPGRRRAASPSPPPVPRMPSESRRAASLPRPGRRAPSPLPAMPATRPQTPSPTPIPLAPLIHQQSFAPPPQPQAQPSLPLARPPLVNFIPINKKPYPFPNQQTPHPPPTYDQWDAYRYTAETPYGTLRRYKSNQSLASTAQQQQQQPFSQPQLPLPPFLSSLPTPPPPPFNLPLPTPTTTTWTFPTQQQQYQPQPTPSMPGPHFGAGSPFPSSGMNQGPYVIQCTTTYQIVPAGAGSVGQGSVSGGWGM